jgi:hypothetical protein
MTGFRSGLKVLGLMLGLMGLVASSASAEAGAKWTVGGTEAGTLLAELQATTVTTAKITLTTKIAAAETKFTTSSVPILLGMGLEGSGKITTGSTVLFTNVETELKGKPSAVCTPLRTPGNDPTLGEVLTGKLQGELVLHTSGVGVVKILPEVGTIITRLYFGEECSLPEEVPVIVKKTAPRGAVFTDLLGISNNLNEHTALAHSLNELWVISETAEHIATLEGEIKVGLKIPHNALTWGGTPG